MMQTIENYLENKRIFLIEDDVVNLGVITKTLARSGAYVCANYSSIGIVVHVIENLPIDVILLDIKLRRGISGYDVLDQLRANPETAHIPVVAVTSLDPEIEIPRAKEKGFNGYFAKPINVFSFSRDLLDVMRGRDRWVFSQ